MLTKTPMAILAGLVVLGVGGTAGAANPTLQGLQGVTQNWDKVLPANDPGGACPSDSSRFVCVLGGAAVRDNETGLVWEQLQPGARSIFSLAHGHCNRMTVGNRKGWRFPTIQELASLADSTVPSPGPALPAGHPFRNVLSEIYWSATRTNTISPEAWAVDFRDGSVRTLETTINIPVGVWCVRGGQGVDPQ